jgi:WD40 repeat protein
MYAQTYFKAVRHFIDDSQLVTTGTDRKIQYWDAVNCVAIRELEGGSGELHSLDLAGDGSFYATAGDERVVKLWDYDGGYCKSIGLGHSTAIRKVKISPDCKRVVSVSEDGAVFIWTIGS